MSEIYKYINPWYFILKVNNSVFFTLRLELILLALSEDIFLSLLALFHETCWVEDQTKARIQALKFMQ